MSCLHEGHDQDCSHEVECPTCAEVVRCPAEHMCHDLAWERFKPPPIDPPPDRIWFWEWAPDDHEPRTYDDTTFADPEPVTVWCCDRHRRQHEHHTCQRPQGATP